MSEYKFGTVRTCDCCERDLNGGWRCRDCDHKFCNNCSKGGRSSGLGVATRTVFGIFTYGASEIARAGYRKAKQKCPYCGSKDLMRI